MMTKAIFTYFYIVIGAIFQGLAMALFLFPHNIPSGGAAGLAIIFHHFFSLPLGTALWLVNFSFLIVALNYFGYSWTIRTMLSVTFTSVTISLTTTYITIHSLSPYVDMLFGSILFGTGVGILIRSGASSGGMVIPALMLANLTGNRPGKVMLWLNFLIFLFTSFVIDIKIVLYAIICQSISTNIIDYLYYFKIPRFLSPSYTWRKK